MRYQLQIIDRAYTVIPDNKWELLSTHRSIDNLRRQYKKWFRWFHPQRNSWTGHVRVVDENGRCFSFGGAHFKYLITNDYGGEWL